MTQLSLLSEVTRQERPWKVVRRVSKAIYAELRKGGYTKRSALKVLRALAYYRNSKGAWPTISELTAFMASRKGIARNESRLVAPRISELVKGCLVKLKDGTRVRRGGGVLVYLPLRECAVTHERVHPVAILEAGAKQVEEYRRSA